MCKLPIFLSIVLILSVISPLHARIIHAHGHFINIHEVVNVAMNNEKEVFTDRGEVGPHRGYTFYYVGDSSAVMQVFTIKNGHATGGGHYEK